MLSTSTVKNVGQASHYFSDKDNYYTKDEGLEQSEWYGKGSKAQNLEGQVDKQVFENLLNGISPEGETLGKMVNGEIKHRAGWDLTLSAPKSVSIMALVAGDKRLIEAHREAVKTTLDQIELACAQARVKKDGAVSFERTNNITAALYHHDLSRAKDPQLHTHSVVMNMTQRTDGKWRSLGSSMGNYGADSKGEINGFIERVRHNNRYYSKLYETELAFRVKTLGYEIKTNSKTGVFEIDGISSEVTETFSKRRLEIVAELESKGMSGGKAASYATLATRENKEIVDREELLEYWEKEVGSHGIDLQAIKDKALNNLNLVKTQIIEANSLSNQDAIKLVQQASKQLAVFQSNFSLEQLVEHASSDAIIKSINVNTLLSAIDHEAAQGNLIPLSNEIGKSIYMAKTTLEDENNLLTLLNDNAANKYVVSPNTTEQILSQHTEIPKEAHADLLNMFDKDKVVLIEGEHNKTRLIEPAIQIAHSSGLRTAIISSTPVAGKKMANEVKLTAQTFWEHIKSIFVNNTPKNYTPMQFIFSAENGRLNEHKPQVLIVEQAHLLSTHQKSKLVQWTNENEAKLLLFGNQNKLLPYQVSTSLKHLTDHGVKTIANNDVMSNDTVINPERMPEILKNLSSRTSEVKHIDDRQQAIASHFLRLSAIEKKTSLIASTSKVAVSILNKQVHDGLVASGELKQLTSYQSLTPVYIDSDKSKFASSYSQDQVVRFNQDYRSMGIRRGEYLKIKRISSQSNRIVLESDKGDRVVWNPSKVGVGKVEAFSAEVKDVGVGEKVVFMRNIKDSNITKGERCTVDSVRGNTVKLKDDRGKTKTIDLSKPENRHFDYSYAATLHSITHERPTTLIADLPAQNINTHQRRLNQIFSQSPNVSIYTNDLKKLEKTIALQSGNQFSANEIKAKSDAIKASLHNMYKLIEVQIAKRSKNEHTSEHVIGAINAVDYALKHLAERSAGFSHAEVMTVAMNHALGDVKANTLTDVIMAMESSGILIRGKANDQTMWTTIEAVKAERQIIALSLQDKGKLEPLANDDTIKAYFKDSNLRNEQVEAISRILTSTDRILSIQGRAGTGKTTMMTSLESVLAAKGVVAESGYILRGLAPTNKAVKELTARGIPSQTLDSFVAEVQQLKGRSMVSDFTKTLFVLDEASMVSNRKMLEVMKIAHAYGFARLIPTGDVHQNPAIESGKPHDLIQKTLGDVISLDQIQRQQNPTLREAALLLYDGKIDKSFELLSESIKEIKNNGDSVEAKAEGYGKRIEAIVEDYMKAKAADHSVQIIAPAHVDRKAINDAVRSSMQQAGKFGECGGTFPVLVSKDMTRVERSKVVNYALGDVLKFTTLQSKDIKSNEFFRVSKIESSHNILLLIPFTGEPKEVIWQVPSSRKYSNNSVEVFKQEQREIKEGDQLVWMRTNKQTGVLSAELSKVTKIEQNQVSVMHENKHEQTFDATDPGNMNWDHGYALTTYSTQGGTYNTVLGFFETSRTKLMNLKTFLVTITRPVHELRLYTNDREKFQKLVTSQNGGKLSSLEVIGDYPILAARKNNHPGQKNDLPEIRPADSSHNKQPSKHRYDKLTIDRIVEGVNKDAEKIAKHLLGNPKVNGGSFLKFGRNQGSLSITIKGERQGWWNDFSEGKGGRGMLSFVQHQAGISKKEAIEFCARWVGIGDISHTESSGINVVKANGNTPKESYEQQKVHEEKKITFAKKLASQSLPAKGTLVEKYLKEQRSIELNKLPEDVRFHPGVYSKLNGQTHPAMLVIARDHIGNIKAVQATYLDPVTGKKVDASTITVQKQSFGVIKGSTVTLGKDQQGAPTLVAEGTETGLSLIQALPNSVVKVTLSKSNFLNLEPKSAGEKVIFCLDQDGKDLKTDKTIFESARRLTEANKQVSLMVPTAASQTKQDYNDVLKEVGEAAIRRDFQNATPFKTMYPQSQGIVVNGVKFDQKQVAGFVNQDAKLANVAIEMGALRSQNQTRLSEKATTELANKVIATQQKIDSKTYKSLANNSQQTKTTPPLTRDFEQNI